MKKRILSLLLVLAMCLSLIACGAADPEPTQSNTPVNTPVQNSPVTGGENTQESTEPAPESEVDPHFLDDAELPETLSNPNISIVYWYNEGQYAYDTSKNPHVYDPILEAIPYFEEKYGGEVNVIYTAWGDMLATVTALQQAGEAPDLFEVYDEVFYSTVLSGVCQPIDDYTTDKDFSYFATDKSLFSWKGSTYAIPLKPFVFHIFFNKDLFDLEGMTYPDELYARGEWTWDAFRDVCKTMTKTVDGETTQLGYGSWEDTILAFMYANGTTFLNTDTATGTVTSNLGDPKVQNTLNYLLDLRDTMVFGNELYDWFDNGKMAMVRAHDFPVDFPFEVGVVPFPTGDDAEGKNLVVFPQGMAVPTGAKNPEGAMAFMRIVCELQLELGDKREAARIGQENYDLIYADDVKPVYAYDKSLHDINYVIACITNYLSDGVPAATIYANMEAELQAELDLMFAPPAE